VAVVLRGLFARTVTRKQGKESKAKQGKATAIAQEMV